MGLIRTSTSTSSSPTYSSSTRCASGCRLSIPHPLSTLPAVLKFHPLRPSDLVPSSRIAIKTPLPLLAQALETTTAGYAASRNYTSNTGQSFGVQQPSSYTSGAGYANAYGNASYTSGAPGGYYGTSGGHGNGNPGAYNGANTATSGGRPTTGTD